MQEINFDIPIPESAAFSESQLRFYFEACMTLLEKQGHRSGVMLSVEGEVERQVRLVWLENAAKSKLRELRDLAEFGAIAIAVHLVRELSDYQVIEQSVIGTGFDYWLGYKQGDLRYNASNFLNARLEVSGIGNGTRRDAKQRLKEKIRQLEVSDYLKIPALIVVVEFSNPLSIIFVK